MKILLAVHESPASQFAVEEVSELPWPEGTEVDVLTVADIEEAAYGPAKELISEATVVIRDAGIRANGHVVAGDPKTAILERAAEFRSDLIVIGAHHGSAITDLFLDNVASLVLRQAVCSVAIVRERADDGLVPRKILLATDGSAESQAAAREIANRPWPVRTEVRILSVVEVVLPAIHALFDPPFVHPEEVQRIREEALIRAQNAVAGALEILTPSRLPVSESVSVLLETPNEVILQEAVNWGADWIFVGPGEIAQSVAERAVCSVQLVRQPSRIAPEK